MALSAATKIFILKSLYFDKWSKTSNLCSTALTNQKRSFYDLTLKIILSLYKPPSHEVPFLPGMAHSHIIKFIVPSLFFIGLVEWNKYVFMVEFKE